MTAKQQAAAARAALDAAVDRAARAPQAAHQTAILRIGLAGVLLLWLLVEFPARHEAWGPDGPWSWTLADDALERSGDFNVLMWSDSTLWFETCYALAVVISVCMLLGWRTRTASVLFVIVLMSFTSRNEFITNSGNDILRLMAIYLVLARCGRVWSLDARRQGRQQDGGDRTGTVLWTAMGAVLVLTTLQSLLPGGWAVILWGQWAVHGAWWRVQKSASLRRAADMTANLLHCGAVLLIMGQVCLIYASAGWYKVQGELWQNGTAVHYSSRLDFLNAWPELSERMVANSVLVLMLTYGTVMVQVAFPFSLLNRRAKNVMLVLLVGEHIGIGVLMGLPYFSLAMIVSDLVFLPTAAALWTEGRLRRLRDRTRHKAGEATGPGPPRQTEAEHAGAAAGGAA